MGKRDTEGKEREETCELVRGQWLSADQRL
jgi:hypothetical protein